MKAKKEEKKKEETEEKKDKQEKEQKTVSFQWIPSSQNTAFASQTVLMSFPPHLGALFISLFESLPWHIHYAPPFHFASDSGAGKPNDLPYGGK